MLSNQVDQTKNPYDFQCPIGYEMMSNPVVGMTGRSYEFNNIAQWISTHHNDPFDTKRDLEIDQLIPNYALKQAIQDYKQLQEQKTTLREIYLQRGKERNAVLETELKQIKFDLAAEQENKSNEQKFTPEQYIWPYPLICPRSFTLIKEPVVAEDGTTYVKTMTNHLKQTLIPNISLKNSIGLFSLEIDEKLREQGKEIKELLKKINEKKEELEQTIMAKLNKQKIKLKKVTQHKQVRKYFFLSSTVLSAGYFFTLIMNFFMRDDLRIHNELAPPENRWNTSSILMQPIVTTSYAFSTLIQGSVSKKPTNFEYKELRADLSQCHTIKSNGFYCQKAIRFAVRYRLYRLLMTLREEIDLTHFKGVAIDVIKNSDLEGLKILHRLNPAILDDDILLVLAVIKDNVDMVKIIVKKDGFNNDGKYGKPLELAMKEGALNTTLYLLENGASLTKTLSKLPRFFWKDQNLDFILRIFSKSEFIFNQENDFEGRFVSYALYNRAPNLADWLLKHRSRFPNDVDLYDYVNNIRLNRDSDEPTTPELARIIIERIAEKKDFEDTISQINISYDQFPLLKSPDFFARFFSILINAGYQLDLNSKTVLSQELLMKSLTEISKLNPLYAPHCKTAPRQKGLEGVLVYAAQHGQSLVVKEVLKVTTINRDIIKQAMLKAHKNHTNTYNLLRSHLRTMDSTLIPNSYSFYQPAALSQSMISKHSQRTHGRGR